MLATITALLEAIVSKLSDYLTRRHKGNVATKAKTIDKTTAVPTVKFASGTDAIGTNFEEITQEDAI